MSSVIPPSPLSYEGQTVVQYINKPFPPPSGFKSAPVPCYWTDTVGQDIYSHVGNGVWINIGGTGKQVETFTTNGPGSVSPNSAGAILVNASTSTYTNGATANTLKTEVQGTNHALFVGRGLSTPATTLSAATNGQIPIGSTGADPTLAVPGNGNNITWTAGAGSLTPNLTGTTNHAVQIGNASASLTSIAVGATGTVLAGTTGADPAFTATPTVTSITLGAGSALSSYIQAGTFTPSIQFGGLSVGITYTTQIGEYTKIGNLVFVRILLTLSSKGSSTGAATMAGFPVTAANSGEQCFIITNTTNITYDAGYQYSFCDTSGTPDTIFDLFEGGSSGTMHLADTHFANNTRFEFNAFYFADGV